MRMLWGRWLQREKSFESGRSLSTGHWFDTLCLTCFWLLHVAALSPFFFLPCCRCWPWMGKRWARSPRSGAACRSGFGIINSKWLLKLQISTEFPFKVKTASNFFLIFELYQISWATYIPENCSQTQTTLGSTFPLTLMLRQALLVTLM